MTQNTLPKLRTHGLHAGLAHQIFTHAKTTAGRAQRQTDRPTDTQTQTQREREAGARKREAERDGWARGHDMTQTATYCHASRQAARAPLGPP